MQLIGANIYEIENLYAAGAANPETQPSGW